MTALKQYESYFWRRVDRSGGEDDCWTFCGFHMQDWVGIIVLGGKKYRTNRVAAHYAGMLDAVVMRSRSDGYVRAICGNRGCCNPKHLTVVTNSRSMKREPTPVPDFGMKPPYNEEQKRLIAKCYKSREWTQMQLAAGFHISQTQVSQIIQKYL